MLGEKKPDCREANKSQTLEENVLFLCKRKIEIDGKWTSRSARFMGAKYKITRRINHEQVTCFNEIFNKIFSPGWEQEPEIIYSAVKKILLSEKKRVSTSMT